MGSNVYFLKPEQFRDLPKAMETADIGETVKKHDFAAVKIHFGEKGNKGYVKPELIKPVIQKLKDLEANVFVTDANTIYRGERTDAVHHLMVASEHNFHPKFLGVPVMIADGLRGNNFVEVETNLKHFKKVKVAEAIYNSDVIVSVAHFKGHELCGIGGALKNIGMGCASRAGKYEMHATVVPKLNSEKCTSCGACIKWCGGGALTLRRGGAQPPPDTSLSNSGGDGAPPLHNKMTIHLDPQKCTGCGQCILACNEKVFQIPWDGNVIDVQEKIAEYTFGVLKNKKALYINFLTFITECCDCFKTMTKPVMPDVGILVGTDPVAIDQASLDLVTKHAGRNILKELTKVDGCVQIEYAEKLGLGSRSYNLVDFF